MLNILRLVLVGRVDAKSQRIGRAGPLHLHYLSAFRTTHINPAPLNDESNSATSIGVGGANSSTALVISVYRNGTRHSIALEHWMATTASTEIGVDTFPCPPV